MSSDWQRGVVVISSADKDSRRANNIGTGFVIHRDEAGTYLLTCAHVVEDVGGEENTIVRGKYPATVVAAGSVEGFDLAVLRVEGLENLPILPLSLASQQDDKFEITGYSLLSSNKMRVRKAVEGTLGEPSMIFSDNYEAEVKVWELQLRKGDYLKSGYSGSPVVHGESNAVIGIVSHLEGNGSRGYAISPEALRFIWLDAPESLLNAGVVSGEVTPNDDATFQAQLKEYEEHFCKVVHNVMESQYPSDWGALPADLESMRIALIEIDEEAIHDLEESILEEAEEEYQANLNHYEEQLRQAVNQQYPLEQSAQDELNQLQESLNLRTEDIERVEQPILREAEEHYRQSLVKKGTDIEVELEITDREAEAGVEKEIDFIRRVDVDGVFEEESQRLTVNVPKGVRNGQKIRLRGQGNEGRYGGENGDVYLRVSVVSAPPKRIETEPSIQLKTLTFETAQIVFDIKVEWSGFLGLGSKIVEVPKIQKSEGRAECFVEDLGNGVELEMVRIPGGSFWMGSKDGEGNDDEKPRHQVKISEFFMGRYLVTQEQWQVIMGNNPSGFVMGGRYPVEQVSWHDCQEFLEELNAQTHRQYRLPSEAEWEYACRAGTETPFYFGETLTTDLANYYGDDTYADELKGVYREETTPVGGFPDIPDTYTYADELKGVYRGETTPVGGFPANGFGLCDMHGNLWEWCGDDWEDNYHTLRTQAYHENSESSSKVLRGGSWNDYPEVCRSACRGGRFGPAHRDDFIGFRVVCAVREL